MKTQIPDRIARLENRLKPKPPLPVAWVAIVEVDGKVSAKHQDHGEHEFENIEAFEAFREKKGIMAGDFIQVIIVNAQDCQGADPREL